MAAQPIPEGDGFDIAHAKRSAQAKRGHITRILRLMQRFIENLDVEEVQNVEPANWIVKHLAKLEKMRDELHVQYETIAVAEPASAAAMTQSQETLETAVNPMIDAIMATLAKIPASTIHEVSQAQTAGPATGNAAADGKQRTGTIAKANTALQPPILTMENTPLELDAWIAQFRAFWRTSFLNTLSHLDQQAYLLQYMDPELRMMVAERISNEMKIFPGPDELHIPEAACINVLKEVFLERYPQFQRRATFFSATYSGKGDRTKLMAYCNKMETLAGIADLDSMTAQDLVAYKVLSSVDDTELQRLCAREVSLNLRILKVHIAAVMRESMSYTPGSVQAITCDPMAKATAPSASSEDGPPSYAEANLVCYNCNKEGHISKNCYQKRSGSRPSASAQPAPLPLRRLQAVSRRKPQRAARKSAAAVTVTDSAENTEVYVPSEEEDISQEE